jgi:hypothetical protein
VISAYARAGKIDHTLHSHDFYATFIENLFLNGRRLNPAQLGNPDSRPTIRDALRTATFFDGRVERIGDMMDDFDFTQAPLPPLVLPTHIPTGIVASCSADNRVACTSPTVVVTWNPVTGPEIPGPFTYHITRDDHVDLPQCIGTATTCQDTPGRGKHLYRAFGVDANGIASPRSAAAEADEP